jgi:ribosome maturation factor RimP
MIGYHREVDTALILLFGELELANISLIRDRVFSLIEPMLEDIGYELVEVEYLSVQGRWVLRLYIDKEGGVTIDDCVNVSRDLGDIIDVKEIIDHEYVLEVSSPGLNRPLRKEKDFINVIGKRIKLKMIRELNGQKNFTGNLKDYNNRTIYLETDGKIIELPFDDVEKSNLIYDFNDSKTDTVAG